MVHQASGKPIDHEDWIDEQLDRERITFPRGYLALFFSVCLCAGCEPSADRLAPSSPLEQPTESPNKARPGRLSSPLPSDPTEIAFAKIPGGVGRIGSPSSEPGRDARTERTRSVRVKPFQISVTEITQAQYWAVMNPSRRFDSEESAMPVTNLTWYEANQFCQLLTVRTGVTHRLPTEVEWEYACRAGKDEMIAVWAGRSPLSDALRSYHRGDSGKLQRGIGASCNIDTNSVLAVGQFPPNVFGLYDMHGNCWEWCSIEGSDLPSPMHAPIRGGSAISTNYLDCRSANRAWQLMTEATPAIGFRIVREG